MKTILFIHERYGVYAGAEEHILALARAIQPSYRLVFAYEILTGAGEACFDAVFETRYQIPFSLFEDPQSPWPDLLRQIQPDLIYVNKCLSVPALQAIIASTIPSVRMVHDHEVYCMRTYKYFPWSRRICHRKAGPCCLVPCLAFIQRDRHHPLGLRWVSYSQKMQLIDLDHQLSSCIVATKYMENELLLQGYDRAKIRLYAPAPPPNEPTRQTEAPTSSSQRTLLFVGQVIRGKGLDCLLKALRLMRTPFRLHICGSGSHEAYCRELVSSLHLEESVEFCGFIPHDQLHEYYRRAAVMCVPSVWPEPFGLVGIEAMRYGLPIVAFDSGGIADWLHDGDNGYLIPWMNIDLMAEKLDYLLEHPEVAHRMGENGQRLAIEQYDFDTYVQRMETCFNELMK